MRVKLRSHSRLTDLFKITAVSFLVSSSSILLGMNTFTSQGCIADFFEENSICKPCREIVNPLCRKCNDRSACNTCDSGYYPIDRSCLDCKQKDENCLECTSEKCTKCKSNMFISRGKCTSCDMITGCMPGADKCNN